MKILFICRANVGRSQAAEGFYNQRRPGGAESAGTIVDNPGEVLSSRVGAVNIINAMQEYDIDISQNTRTQLTEAMAGKYEKLIVMAEPENIPQWLKNNPKTEIWTIKDAKGQDLNTTRVIAGQIKDRVARL